MEGIQTRGEIIHLPGERAPTADPNRGREPRRGRAGSRPRAEVNRPTGAERRPSARGHVSCRRAEVNESNDPGQFTGAVSCPSVKRKTSVSSTMMMIIIVENALHYKHQETYYVPIIKEISVNCTGNYTYYKPMSDNAYYNQKTVINVERHID